MTSYDTRLNEWPDLLMTAAARFGTPCHVATWHPVAEALDALQRLPAAGVRLRSWFSLKTHPVMPLAQKWLQSGLGVEVVSECELVAARRLGATVDQLLVNGVAKHAWLGRHSIPRLRVHFDSRREVELLLPVALAAGWRVGIRCHAPDERDARDPNFGGQFGMTEQEAVWALRTMRAAGADVRGVHFHLGQRPQQADSYARAVAHAARICDDASFEPRYVDLGGGLPARAHATHALAGLERGIAAARALFRPALEEIWLENGRFVTDASSALVVRVLDIKERADSRYLVCDGGRTNHALAADKGAHPLRIMPVRSGAPRLTTVCGPTCMTDDVLARQPLPGDIENGDLIGWMHAGAYHLPWETRFSHGLCAVVWCDGESMELAREREHAETWADKWMLKAA